MAKTDTQLMDDLRIELASYVKLRERIGPSLTFQQALAAHRQVCSDNAIGEVDGFFAERRRLCDRLMLAEGLTPSVPETYR